MKICFSENFHLYFISIIQAAHCVSSFEPYEIRVSELNIFESFKMLQEKLSFLRLLLADTIFQEITQKSRESRRLSLMKTLTSLLLTTTLRCLSWKPRCSIVLASHLLVCRVEVKPTSRISWRLLRDGEDYQRNCQHLKPSDLSSSQSGHKKNVLWLVTDRLESLLTWCVVDTQRDNVTGKYNIFNCYSTLTNC